MNDIVFICDDNYVMPTEVMIKSICYNWYGTEKLSIHICSWQLSDKNIELLNRISDNKAVINIHIADTQKYEKKMALINQNSHVTSTALLKFELANILEKVDQVLYLDSDMICKKDITPLLKIRLEENYIAASFDYWKYIGKQYEFQMNNSTEFYFNSGVMLLNLNLFRNEKVVDKLWECKLRQFNPDTKGKFGLMDQDTFNEVCKDHIYPLPIKYNCNCYFTHDTDIEHINMIYGTEYRSLHEMEDDAIIIHFVGKEDKPWKYKNVACQNYWDKYYLMTGRTIDSLNRVTIKKGIKYYATRIKTSIQVRGFNNTIKYIALKIRRGSL